MARPTFLVVEIEPGSALSTRKLILETAKFNVITAHSTNEAREFLKLAPELYAAVIVATDIRGAEKFVLELKKNRPDLPLICASANRATSLKCCDHFVPSHEPQTLVDLCRELFGDPRNKND
jgi:DNA-binding NtrC family response regulator